MQDAKEHADARNQAATKIDERIIEREEDALVAKRQQAAQHTTEIRIQKRTRLGLSKGLDEPVTCTVLGLQ